jgi:outer membrane cobalamin receptor
MNLQRPFMGSVCALTLAACATVAAAQSAEPAAPTKPKPKPTASDGARMSEVVVTASRADLMGKALTASQGSVTAKEIELRPVYRIGQIYESVPGLVVTVHSGEGKANQYLLRGFNLDHGTDFASFIDDMPVNRPTNAHGQGYSDQNFLMSQIVEGVDYTKGPFYADIGDFGAVGSAHVRLTDDLASQVQGAVGTLGDEDLFAGGTHRFDTDDRLWAAADVGHLDGPWSPPGEFNRVNVTTRFSHGTDADGFSVTGMYYHSAGRLETDQSIYALQDGLIGRYGTLDPSDRSQSERYSLSGHYGATLGDWRLSSNVYAIHSTMTLWNDFTHYLFDPVNGDQEQQDETRNTYGAAIALMQAVDIGSIRSVTTFGLQDRYDSVYVDRRHTRDRVTLDYCELANTAGTAATPYAAVKGACTADQVELNDLGMYVQTTIHWTPWLRTVFGFREEAYWAVDHSLTAGTKGSTSQTLHQPKGSLIFGPFYKTEVYLSDGEGFHSDDAREVFHTVPYEGTTVPFTPQLIAKANSEEVGLRTALIPKLQVQLAAFQEDFSSELAYDQDQGEDQAGAPSRRQGVEASAQYHPKPWLELNTDLAWSKARYRGSPAELETVYGVDGRYIANAPSFIGSFGVLVDNLGPWYGGLQWRDLGPYPVADGQKYPRDKGYSEVNVDAGYKVNAHLQLQASIFNLFNSKANAAAYDYTSRLVPDGPEVTGLQVHPLEPISGEVKMTYRF